MTLQLLQPDSVIYSSPLPLEEARRVARYYHRMATDPDFEADLIIDQTYATIAWLTTTNATGAV